jgi:predicted RNase H-like HicB family nuclease
MTDGIPLSHKWRKTWEGTEDDFVGIDDGETFARIYKNHMGAWAWYMNAHDYPGVNGQASTPREAAKAAEEAWERAKAGTAQQEKPV